ncbi:MAG: hypothetical protein WBE83_14380 [Candidatus Cybelea sp.]|jgi:uncharacterized membrane protein YkvA (DUF1232 family)
MRLIRLLLAAKSAIFRTVPLMRDTRVPLALKLVAAAIGVLVISPIDIFGDIPVLGALDDAALLAILSMWFVSQAGKHVEPIPVRPLRASVLACQPIR